MVSRTDLIAAVADALGEDAGMVKVTARHLRVAGLMKQGAPGRGGVGVTAQDAANLIIGVLIGRPARAAERVPDFRSLTTRLNWIAPSAPEGAPPMPKFLNAVARSPDFGTSFERLIAGCVELEAWMIATYGEERCRAGHEDVPTLLDSGPLRLTVKLSLRPSIAEILLENGDGDREAYHEPSDLLHCDYLPTADPEAPGYSPESTRISGRRDYVEIDHTVLFPIARVVAGRAQ